MLHCLQRHSKREAWVQSTTIVMEEVGAAGVRARLQPPSMSIRSWGHDSATADSALERSLVLLCRLRICTKGGIHHSTIIV